MGSAKDLMAEREEDQARAVGLLLQLRVLKACPFHEDEIREGSEDLSKAYPIAQSMITKGDIKLRSGQTRADFMDSIKAAFDEHSLSDGCYYCNKD